MEESSSKQKIQKTVVIGAGPVGSLAALYAANRGHDVEVYELRGGKLSLFNPLSCVHENLLFNLVC